MRIGTAGRSPVAAALAAALALAGCPRTIEEQSAPPGLPLEGLPAGYAGRANPYRPDDPRVLAEGARLYRDVHFGLSCSACHGMDGRGRGPAWPYLEPRPPSFGAPALLAAFRERPDQVLWWVSSGVDRTPMPAFAPLLSEEERWKVITYAWHLGLLAAGPGEPARAR